MQKIVNIKSSLENNKPEIAALEFTQPPSFKD